MKGKKELKRYKVGDRSKGCCSQCGLVETVFEIRDLPISDEEENVVAVAKGILVGVCTKCGKTITTPQQSSREIREALEKGKK